MPNPILQMLNNRPQANPMQAILQMAKGNPEAAFNQLMQSNPKFSQFVSENKGKTPDQIAKEHGINPEMLKQFIK